MAGRLFKALAQMLGARDMIFREVPRYWAHVAYTGRKLADDTGTQFTAMLDALMQRAGYQPIRSNVQPPRAMLGGIIG